MARFPPFTETESSFAFATVQDCIVYYLFVTARHACCRNRSTLGAGLFETINLLLSEGTVGHGCRLSWHGLRCTKPFAKRVIARCVILRMVFK